MPSDVTSNDTFLAIEPVLSVGFVSLIGNNVHSAPIKVLRDTNKRQKDCLWKQRTHCDQKMGVSVLLRLFISSTEV